MLRAFKKAGLDGQRARGALVHGLRHTYATSSNADVSVNTLMKLLGHESMTTSQRYVSGAGTENRAAAAQNLLYELMQQPISKVPLDNPWSISDGSKINGICCASGYLAVFSEITYIMSSWSFVGHETYCTTSILLLSTTTIRSFLHGRSA